MYVSCLIISTITGTFMYMNYVTMKYFLTCHNGQNRFKLM